MTELIVENVQKWLGGLQILKGASLTAQRGSIMALPGCLGLGQDHASALHRGAGTARDRPYQD